MPDFKYGTQPNAFLAEQAGRLSAGSDILLPGDGEGRNSVWLATQGHRVTALDNSAVGLQKAIGLAARNQVAIQTLHADLAQWMAPTQAYDAIALIYLHLPTPLRTATHRQCVNALRPGGWLLLEAFHPRQLGYTSGGPKDEALLYTIDMLRADLQMGATGPLEEILAWEGMTHLSEGPGHQGPACVTRFIARKTAS